MSEEIHSIQSELEETIQHWMEGVLLCIDQKTQGLRDTGVDHVLTIHCPVNNWCFEEFCCLEYNAM
jgi:hypothetical protein